MIAITCSLYGQEVNIYDKFDLQPIENVVIVNNQNSQTSLTNNNGVAFLDVFDKQDTLQFQHTSYLTAIYTFRQLEEAGFTIGLTERSVRLGEVVVAASKWEENKEEVPSRIVTISSKDISFRNPQTTADMLEGTGEVFVQKSQQGGGSPMIRGFAANAVLIVIDGIRMNNAIYRGGNLHNVISLDPNTIENAEVIFGPGSVMYGSDALGGVMDFHTYSPALAYEGKQKISVGFLARYASANNERTGHIHFNYGRKKWGFYTSVSGNIFDDLKMGSVFNDEYLRKEYAGRIDNSDVMMANSDPKVQKFSGYDQFNIMQKVRFRPGKELDLEYAFHYSKTTDIPRYDRLTQYTDDNILKYADWHYGPMIWNAHMINARIFKSNVMFSDARFILAYQDYRESRHSRKFGSDMMINQEEEVDIFSLNADFDKDFNPATFLLYGLEIVYNNVSSKATAEDINTGESEPSGTRYPDGKNHYLTLAAYINFKKNITDNLTFLAGARYTAVRLNSTITDENFYELPFNSIENSTGSLSGSTGMTFRPEGGWQINLNFATGFRAPNLDDIAKVFDSEPGAVVVPNPGLNPEHSYNLDLAVIKKIGNKVQLDLSAFYTWLTDAIVRRDFTFNGMDSIMYQGEMSKVKAMINADRATIYGMNLGVKYDIIDLLSLNVTASYSTGEDNEGNALRHVPPLFGSAALLFRTQKFRAELSAVYNGEISYDNLAPSERSKTHMYATDENGNPFSPYWWTLNLKSSWQINKNIGFDFGIDNILDHRYRPYSSGIVAAGRNIYFGLKGKF